MLLQYNEKHTTLACAKKCFKMYSEQTYVELGKHILSLEKKYPDGVPMLIILPYLRTLTETPVDMMKALCREGYAYTTKDSFHFLSTFIN